MNNQTAQNQEQDLISKFPNGRERMNTSALFNQTIHSLSAGIDPLAIIDQLITITENTQKEFEKHIRACPGPPIVISAGEQEHSGIFSHWKEEHNNNNNWDEPMIKHFQD